MYYKYNKLQFHHKYDKCYNDKYINMHVKHEEMAVKYILSLS